jgi:hypothetical protein
MDDYYVESCSSDCAVWLFACAMHCLKLPLYISMFRVAFPGLSPLGTPVTHRSVEYLNVLWGSVLLQLHPFTSRHDIGP